VSSAAAESVEFPNSMWPQGFDRVPDEDWARQPVEESGVNYDRAGSHGWYSNLEPTVAQALSVLDEHKRMVDYSCGTGILADRILAETSDRVGILNVDASAKFLRVAVDKFADDERVAFRLLDWLPEQKRLQLLDEVTGDALTDPGLDLLTSTNAIHLYGNLAETLASWHRTLRTRGLALISSGNIDNPNSRPGDVIIDQTVSRVNEIAAEIVRTEPAFERYRAVLDDEVRMAAHKRFREKVFVPVRPLDTYLDALSDTGFQVLSSYTQTVFVSVREFFEALGSYHDGVLGWVGGTRRVEGEEPTDDAVRDRLFLIRYSMERLYGMQDTFPSTWTYLTCRAR
jgi:SAM-dependent methyltransferase